MTRWLRVTAALALVAMAGCARGRVPARPATSHGPIEFRMVLQEPQHLKGQPMLVRFQLISRARKPLLVNRRMFVNAPQTAPGDREVVLDVIGPDGMPLPCRQVQAVGLPKVEDFVMLAPGQVVESERMWDISQLYGMDQAGTYVIRATYQNARGPELGLAAFAETVPSAPVTVKVDAIP